MMPEGNWPLTLRRPHAARDRLQADAVLIGRPDLDRRVRMFALLCRCSFFELFLTRRGLSPSRSPDVVAAAAGSYSRSQSAHPAAPVMHEFATMKVRQPARNLGPRPKATVIRRRLDPLFECLKARV
jgi:hypothetical protein